ncbi:universal stress protein [Pacificimonas sp. WHA3]|uniref:Universal stress protein n=1 Tax=Pacificimonas pallii TaxID=2827236 RepID=A0ABS6SCD4_9SPHN|nr:universal stress protein [Pacificimonas pallii]MBV7255581.1 universal stress protein [Pacificimonas pallii]
MTEQRQGGHILACIDASEYATSVIDNAAYAAERLGVGVEVLHVIQRADAVARRRDLSGAVGLGAKSALMSELTELEAAEAKLARRRGELMLADAKLRLTEQGITDVTLTHRHGGIIETIIEREADARIVVMGKRGASADFAHGHIGSKVERIVRASEKPVFVVSKTYRGIRRIVIAYDGGEMAARAAELAATSPLTEGCAIYLVMCGRSTDENRAMLDAAAARFDKREVKIRLQAGKTETVIAQAVEDFAADLVLMGAYSHAPLRTLLVGSTTSTMMRTCKVPVLLFR